MRTRDALRARVVDVRSAEAAWRAIEAVRPDLPVSRGWTWTAAWLRHFGPHLRHELLVVEDSGGAPVGAGLLVRRVHGIHGIGVRRTYVGTGGEPGGERLCPEVNLPAAVPGADGAVLDAVVAFAETRRWWDELRIERADDPGVRGLLARWSPRRVETETMPAYQYELDALMPDQDIPGGLRGGPRRRVRTTLRAMAARGDLHLDWAEDAATGAEILEELIALHQDAWIAVGKPGIFASARFAGFHRELAPALVAAGRATMVRVSCGDETIAALYGFRDGDRLRAYQSGLRRFDDNRLRPGIVAHVMAMEAARLRGFAVYDHLAGDARYKQELSTTTAPTHSYAFRRRRFSLAVYDGVRDIRDRQALASTRAQRAAAPRSSS